MALGIRSVISKIVSEMTDSIQKSLRNDHRSTNALLTGGMLIANRQYDKLMEVLPAGPTNASPTRTTYDSHFDAGNNSPNAPKTQLIAHAILRLP
jgi:hypothetical protein